MAGFEVVVATDQDGSRSIVRKPVEEVIDQLKGEKGDKGDPGVSVVSTHKNTLGELILTFSDGTVSNVGSIIGSEFTTEILEQTVAAVLEDHVNEPEPHPAYDDVESYELLVLNALL